MYLPYIRGRQYDLIAIRELARNPTIYEGELMLPMVEPVDLKNTPLASYRVLAENRTPFILIANPQHGGITEREVRRVLIDGILAEHPDYYIGFIINERTTLANLRRFITENAEYQVSLIHYSLPPSASDVAAFINGCTDIAHNIFLNEKLTNAYIRSIRSRDSKRITLKDGFNKATNNAAYAAIPEEHFHDLHITYEADGYDGFGDFCTIGEVFDPRGFAPLAVAVHLTHATPTIPVVTRHFVSDDMADRTNPAGKFGQAVGKLDAFIRRTPTFEHTLASQTFRAHHTDGTYPGLPSIKKLSMMHHMEMMQANLAMRFVIN